jgi:hypothetical protein
MQSVTKIMCKITPEIYNLISPVTTRKYEGSQYEIHLTIPFQVDIKTTEFINKNDPIADCIQFNSNLTTSEKEEFMMDSELILYVNHIICYRNENILYAELTTTR